METIERYTTLAKAELEHATITLQKDTEAEYAAAYFVTIDEGNGLPSVSERGNLDYIFNIFTEAIRFEELER